MKKILKRLSSIVLISMTLMIGCIYTGATAYEYVVDYDVNMDYKVNIRDVVFINKILMGQGKANTPEYLDVNGNGIADEVDSKMILYYITGKNVYYNQQ